MEKSLFDFLKLMMEFQLIKLTNLIRTNKNELTTGEISAGNIH